MNPMNPIREAAFAMEQAENEHPGLAMRMDVTHTYVTIHARRKHAGYSRIVTWAEIEAAKLNILTATVALVVNRIMGE